MAHFVITAARVEINSVVLSDHVESVSLEYKAELQDDTNMGDTTRSASAVSRTGPRPSIFARTSPRPRLTRLCSRSWASRPSSRYGRPRRRSAPQTTAALIHEHEHH